MRLREFTTTSTSSAPESNLVTALELLRNRYKDSGQPATISTQSLINLVLNTDKYFSYSALADANETNPAVKNLIKSFNRDTVELNPTDSEDDSTTTNIDQDTSSIDPVDTVDSMAKRAAKTRGAPI